MVLTCVIALQVSPSSRNIWGSPVKEAYMPPAVNNLQTLFEFAKAASGPSHGKVRLKDLRSSLYYFCLLLKSQIDLTTFKHLRFKIGVSYSYQNTCCWLWHLQGVSGRTLEELENQILPGTKGHAMTAEDLERQLRGEGSKPPPLPEPHLQHPPPGFLPGSPGPRNQTPQVRKE